MALHYPERLPPIGVVARWLAAGLLFMGINTALLYLLVRWGRQPVPLATFICAEVCTLLRYVVNASWVFHGHGINWKGLCQYHLANAGAFCIWWVAANALHFAGMNYLVASVLAVGFSTGFSFASNYYWIWRVKHPAKGA